MLNISKIICENKKIYFAILTFFSEILRVKDNLKVKKTLFSGHNVQTLFVVQKVGTLYRVSSLE